MIRIETTSLPPPLPILALRRNTSPASDIRLVQVAIEGFDLLLEEDDCRAVLEAPIAPFFAAVTIANLVAGGDVFAVVALAFRRHAVGEDVEDVKPV